MKAAVTQWLWQQTHSVNLSMSPPVSYVTRGIKYSIQLKWFLYSQKVPV